MSLQALLDAAKYLECENGNRNSGKEGNHQKQNESSEHIASNANVIVQKNGYTSPLSARSSSAVLGVWEEGPRKELSRNHPRVTRSTAANSSAGQIEEERIQVKRPSVTLTHNQLEKNRRAHLRECFDDLKACIPRLGLRRSSNLTILNAALKQIQSIERKRNVYESTKIKLQNELIQKSEKLDVLLEDLDGKYSKKQIEDYLDECLKKDVKAMQDGDLTNSFLLDEDQASTSTASEAEDEDFQASLNKEINFENIQVRPIYIKGKHVGFQKIKAHKDSHAIIISKSKLSDDATRPCEENSEIMNDSLCENDERHSSQPISNSNLHRHSSELRPLLIKDESSPNKKKQTRKLCNAPSGRSCTPSPPSSNMISFFPRFGMGSGGSPPLHSQMPMEQVKLKEFTQKSPSNCQVPISITMEQKHVEDKKSSPDTATGKAGKLLTCTETKTLPSLMIGPGGTVSLPSFSGYQVKVKYISPSMSMAKHGQANIPMKKRFYSAEPAGNVVTSSQDAAMGSSPVKVNEVRGIVQMTSLYVGASAGVLAQSSEDKKMSNSDNEGDGTMFDWGSYSNLKKERNRDAVKRKLVGSSAIKINAASNSSDKTPKTLFSLWDRKHHAVTMTTATNWRGKLQKELIVSNTKFAQNRTSGSLNTAPLTQVSYTTLKNAKSATSLNRTQLPTVKPITQYVFSSPARNSVFTSDKSELMQVFPPHFKLVQNLGVSSSQAVHIVPISSSSNAVHNVATKVGVIMQTNPPESKPTNKAPDGSNKVASITPGEQRVIVPVTTTIRQHQIPVIIPVSYMIPSISKNNTITVVSKSKQHSVIVSCSSTKNMQDLSVVGSPNLSDSTARIHMSRSSSTDSASSSTLSIDSGDTDLNIPEKRPRLMEPSDRDVKRKNNLVPQYVLPPSFVFPVSVTDMTTVSSTEDTHSVSGTTFAQVISSHHKENNAVEKISSTESTVSEASSASSQKITSLSNIHVTSTNIATTS